MSETRKTCTKRYKAVLLVVVAGLSSVAPLGGASAASLIEMLFGRARRGPPPLVQMLPPFAAAERGESVQRGPSSAYCVRLCDGRPFPVQASGLSPAQACSAFCPAAATKVFAGSNIDYAVASDGKRYADLPNAFVYRKQLVANCTCNGRTPGGLVAMDARSDPTLRPGDLVATREGLMAFRSSKNQVADFTPVHGPKLPPVAMNAAGAAAFALAPPPAPDNRAAETRRRSQTR